MRTDIVAGLCLQGVACLAPLPGAALLPLFGTGSGAEHPHAEAQLAGAPAHLLARSAPIAAQFHVCSVEQVSIVLIQIHCSFAGPSCCSTTSTKASARSQPQQQQQRKLQQFWLFK
jgi:hypothetical protein